jgi:hypothetical protein
VLTVVIMLVMVADGVELGYGAEDVEVDRVALADTTDELAAGVPETEGVALAGTTLTEGELDGEALTTAVGLVTGGETDADGLSDTARREGVTEVDALALTLVPDGDALNNTVGDTEVVGEPVALTEGVALADTVVAEGEALSDGELVASVEERDDGVPLDVTMVADGVLVGDIDPVTDAVELGVI